MRLSAQDLDEKEYSPERSEISKYLSEIGRKGGLKGGKAKANRLTHLSKERRYQEKLLRVNGLKVRYRFHPFNLFKVISKVQNYLYGSYGLSIFIIAIHVIL